MADIEKMKEDTERILSEWGRKVVVKRLTLSYSTMGEPEEGFSPVDQGGTVEVTCDLQPIGGDLSFRMDGVLSSATHRAFFPSSSDIKPNDRVYLDEENFLFVLRVDAHPDHLVAYLKERR